jgi:hypothetical protein
VARAEAGAHRRPRSVRGRRARWWWPGTAPTWTRRWP